VNRSTARLLGRGGQPCSPGTDWHSALGGGRGRERRRQLRRGALVSSVVRDADGLTEQTSYGDVAQTRTLFQYDARQRLSAVMTYRVPPALWTADPSAYTPAPNPEGDPSVFQTVLENTTFAYDAVDNPTALTDLRDPAAWPASFKPSTRTMQYDDLYRVKRAAAAAGPRGR
jgi:hypothetical protein